ncbi:hypothetical protein R1flu_029060 [Riccia fluitans]|uniref:Uncharacterized protein n=1 Tax=Riccia fluitans TaxID=41844 RepID=A0ABD1XNG3_9MARC
MQENRCRQSFELIPPPPNGINFTTKDRRLIPESVLDQVRRFNSLDLELHSHAQLRFAKQQDALARGGDEESLEMQEKSLDIVSEEMDVPEKAQKESPWQDFWGYVAACGVFVALSAFAFFFRILRKQKPLKDWTPNHVRYSLFMGVHEKI